MKSLSYLLCLSGLLLFACSSPSQPPTAEPSIDNTSAPADTPTAPARFEEEIKRFEQMDREQGLRKNGVLFTGSSSIRMWTTLEEDMIGFPVINRGFGGATIPEVLKFADRYLFAQEPRIVVFYCGENDIAEGASPEAVFNSFKAFTELLEMRLPGTRLVYLSMKPSTARWELWDKYRAGDELIKAFIDEKEWIEFMDTSLSMLEKNGAVKTDIFIEDGLHMNAKGYAGWTTQLLSLLEYVHQK